MNTSSLIFCVASLVVCLGLAWLAFPMAALDEDTVARYKTPQPAYMLDDVDVGGGFGAVPAEELIGYYVENPPAATATEVPEVKFGGC